MKKFLVTGGTGFIGSAIVKALVEKGQNVRVLDDNSRGNARRLETIEGRYEFFQGDVRSERDVQKAMEGINSVIHLAAVNGTQNFYTFPERVLEVAVKGMVYVIDAAISRGVQEIFLASSSEVYQTPEKIPTDETEMMRVPDPYNPRYSYAGGKIISELLLANYGRSAFKRAVIFRPHNVYGPDMGNEHVIPQFALRMNELVLKYPDGEIPFEIQGKGEETRGFVYIDDFVAGLMLLFERAAHQNTYNIGSDVETPIKEIAFQVANAFGRDIELKPGALQPGSTLRRCPDISKIRELGYQMNTSLCEGIKKTVEWYKTRENNNHE